MCNFFVPFRAYSIAIFNERTNEIKSVFHSWNYKKNRCQIIYYHFHYLKARKIHFKQVVLHSSAILLHISQQTARNFNILKFYFIQKCPKTNKNWMWKHFVFFLTDYNILPLQSEITKEIESCTNKFNRTVITITIWFILSVHKTKSKV